MKSSSASSRTAWPRRTARTGSSWTASPGPSPRPRLWTRWAWKSTLSSTSRWRTRTSSPACPDAVSAKAAAPPTTLLYKQPKVEGKCDICGGTLVQRKDDHPDTVKERLDVYHDADRTPQGVLQQAGQAACCPRPGGSGGHHPPGDGGSGGFDMIVLKTSRELSLMREAGQISAKGPSACR